LLNSTKHCIPPTVRLNTSISKPKSKLSSSNSKDYPLPVVSILRFCFARNRQQVFSRWRLLYSGLTGAGLTGAGLTGAGFTDAG
jgi:hypothetical protein